MFRSCQQIGDILDLIWLVGLVDFFTTCFLVRFPRMQRISRHFSHGKRSPSNNLAASLPRFDAIFCIPEFEETSIFSQRSKQTCFESKSETSDCLNDCPIEGWIGNFSLKLVENDV